MLAWRPWAPFVLQARYGQTFLLLFTAQPRLSYEACQGLPGGQGRAGRSHSTAEPPAGDWLLQVTGSLLSSVQGRPTERKCPPAQVCPSGFGRGRTCLFPCLKHLTPASVPSPYSPRFSSSQTDGPWECPVPTGIPSTQVTS